MNIATVTSALIFLSGSLSIVLLLYQSQETEWNSAKSRPLNKGITTRKSRFQSDVWVTSSFSSLTPELTKKIKQIKDICRTQHIKLSGTRWCHNITHFHLLKRPPEVMMIGAPKSGTSMTARFLHDHPFIVTPGPEIGFFGESKWPEKCKAGLSGYARYMPYSVVNQIGMTRNPLLLQSPEVPSQVASVMPGDTKFLILLREPVERTISHYSHLMEMNYTDPLFETYKSNSGVELIRNDTINIVPSTYIVGLESWLKYFPLENFLFLSTEEIQQSPAKELRKIETFLGLPHWFEDEFFYERSKTLCNRITKAENHPRKLSRNGMAFKINFDDVNILSEFTCQLFSHKHPSVDTATRLLLRTFFTPYNDRIFKIIGKRFDW